MESVTVKPTGNTPRSASRQAQLEDPDGSILIPPAEYLTAVRKTLGVIDLDPCSTAIAQREIDAQSWYPAAAAESALAEVWCGRVFLHPHPNTTIARYQLQKTIRHYLSDRITAVMILTGKIDFLRQEPIFLSFPFLMHYKRLSYWRFMSDESRLQRVNPSFGSTTIYLPDKSGNHFNEESVNTFLDSFSAFGRVIINEDLGDDWQQDALLASARAPIKPVLTQNRINRYEDF